MEEEVLPNMLRLSPEPVCGERKILQDMDLIEVLWKQDVDMGYSLNNTPNSSDTKRSSGDNAYSPDQSFFSSNIDEEDEIENFKKVLKDVCEDKGDKGVKGSTETKSESIEDDPWAGFSYTIDTETGEYVLSGELPEGEGFDYYLEETLRLIDLDDASPDLQGEVKSEEASSKKKEESQPEGEMLAPRYHPHPHPHHHHHHHHPHHHHGGPPEHHALAPPPPPQQQQQHHAAHAAHHHFAAAYHHQNLVRSMSMEQRWQDLATLLALPAPAAPGATPLTGPTDPHHHHLYPQHHVNSTLGHCSQGSPAYMGPPYAPLPAEKPTIAATPDIYGTPNISTAVAASMNVSHTTSGCTASGGGPPPFYKAEHPPQEHQPDHMYYQNTTNELNGTSDGFLSQILNDEDLQLMDMAMNEGMYTMRMLESGGGGASGGGPLPPHIPQPPPPPPHTMTSHHISMGAERIDASSDSAVSSMGSERVPSLSDSEWCDAGSDSAQDYHSKLRPCDNESRQPPLVAQKKHHMFGKRCFQEQTTLGRLRGSGHDDHQMTDVKFEYEQPSVPASAYIPDVGHMVPEMKYSCTMEFNAGGVGIGVGSATGSLRHNHTYSLPPAPPQPPHRPLARDKRGRKGSETPGLAACGTQAPMSRDDKRARALGIPLSVHDIINLPMDEFNERLSKHDLSETQLSLIRDIRRRGKNKVAAQNCRKRKLDQITCLADEVRDVRCRKQRLQRDRHMLLAQRQRAKEHFAALYRHVFQHLRDADGNPLSSQQYSLQQAADGAVVLVPRASASLLPDSRSPRSVERHLSSNGTSDDDLDRIKIKQRKSFDQ
ncbi:NFE2 like bZIP transcription factor cap-n-collar isoform X2 [Arctopsyche grandis]|uniref:NFE2 like bZIP transcription factor cap-n-collar isoform X2 n=1 Tax=Arctopsyche grandis TaxID=121162 RepID=UPI00406D9F54